MDSSCEAPPSQRLAPPLHNDAAHFKVTYVQGRSSKQPGAGHSEDFKKRTAASRSGNNPGRVKRVVSCKRKTHHATAARRKPASSARSGQAANKENQKKSLEDSQQQVCTPERWDVPQSHRNNLQTPDQSLRCSLEELSEDHQAMTEVLCGRILRLRVAFTLWQSNVGELLTFFLRDRDISVLVDFLPILTKSLEEDSSSLTIGCCVDLCPLVGTLLSSPYEEYLVVGLKWINSVTLKWSEELKASGFRGETKVWLDKNYQVFNQRLLELWEQEASLRSLRSLPGAAGDAARAVDSFLSQLI